MSVCGLCSEGFIARKPLWKKSLDLFPLLSSGNALEWFNHLALVSACFGSSSFSYHYVQPCVTFSRQP